MKSENEDENYTDLCRLCANYDAIRMDIFSEKGRERNLVDKITTCLPFEVAENDLFPKSLCYKCIHNLETFYVFRKDCIDAKRKLERVLKIPEKIKSELKETHDEKYGYVKVEPKGDIGEDEFSTEGEDETPNPADFLEASLFSGDNFFGRTEDEEGPFTCKTCSRSFNSRSSLTIHAKFHQDQSLTDSQPFSCYVCKKVFSSKGHLALHSKVHIGETGTSSTFALRPSPGQMKLYRCDLCNKSYSMAKHLWGHVSSSHKGDPLVTCNLCARTFSSISNLEDHKRVKHKDEDHLEDGDSNDRKDGSVLDGSITNDENLNSDDNTGDETNQDRQVYSCLLCVEKFNDTHVLSEHLMTAHGYDGSYDFEHIRSMFADSEYPGNTETTFSCEICIREFNDRASLWLHMLYSHKVEASKACGICLKICADNESLQQHVELCHPRNKTEQKRYSCQVCARQHDSRKKLVTHAKIHKLMDSEGNPVDPETVVVLNSDIYSTEVQQNQNQNDDGYMTSCDICFKIFESDAKLAKHKRSTHRDSSGPNTSISGSFYFACELCGLSHLSRSERWRHMATCHEGDLNVTCAECGKVFPTSAVKREHETNHHLQQGQFPNTCEVCGKLWKTRVEYWKHMMGVHPDCLPYICGVCLKVFCNIPNLVSHVRETHWPLDGGDFCCDICGRPYSKVSKMTRHRKVHYVPDTPPELQLMLEHPKIENRHFLQQPAALICDMCHGSSLEYESIEALGKHRLEVHNMMPCDLCTKYYGRTSHLWKHVNKIHKGHPEITCPVCGRTSASKAHLATHVAKHHRDDENSTPSTSTDNGVHTCLKCSKVFRKEYLMIKHSKHCKGPRVSGLPVPAPVNGMYSCERCGKSYPSEATLIKHMNTSHIKYKCELCPSQVLSKMDLYNHVKEKHGDHPDVRCSYENCNKILRCKYDLERHQKDHRQSAQQHYCIFCAEIYTGKLKLKKHLRAVHRKIAKYLCAICLKGAPSFKELQTHVQTEHKSALEKPNSCPICGRSCCSKSKLMKHIQYHNANFHPCKICMRIFGSQEQLTAHLDNHPSDSCDEEEYQIEDMELDANSIMDIIGASDMTVKTNTSDKDSEDEEPDFKKIKKEFECNSCSETFDEIVDLEKHKDDKHKPKNESILHLVLEGKKNVPTDKNFLQQLGLMPDEKASPKTKSNRKVYDDDFTPSACQLCGKVWPAKRHLWQHLIRFHRKEAGTSCGICLAPFKDYIDMSIHLACEHPINFDGDGTNLTCKVCGKYHNARSKLQNHVVIHVGHEERAMDSMHHCLICYETFPVFRLFCNHIQAVHGIKPIGKTDNKKIPVNGASSSKPPFISCDVCSLVFASEQGLINHRRTHIHSDSFKCGQCGELFGSQIQLSNHKVEKHKGTEFVCADCKGNFSTYSQLTEHNKICKAKPKPVDDIDSDDENKEEDSNNESESEVESEAENLSASSDAESGEEGIIEEEDLEDEEEDMDDDDDDMEIDEILPRPTPVEVSKIRPVQAFVGDLTEVVKVEIPDDSPIKRN